MTIDTQKHYVVNPITKKLRFTTTGIALYKSEFAQLGIDINSIKTFDRYSDALEKLFSRDMTAFAAENTEPLLDEIMKICPAWRHGMQSRETEKT